MENQEELLTYFKRKASDILHKYAIPKSRSDYGYQYLRMASYFGQFNENMIALEKELNSETEYLLSNHLKENMDITCVINGLNAYCNSAKLQYIVLNNP